MNELESNAVFLNQGSAGILKNKQVKLNFSHLLVNFNQKKIIMPGEKL